VTTSIPINQIKATPRADGGYCLSVYKGNVMGWVMLTTVTSEQGLDEAIRNITRPTVVFNPPDYEKEYYGSGNEKS